jgi:GNAT superfamily N-acetyltransferase
MSDLIIKAVDNEVDKMRFIKFPWEIYKGDDNWVPPIIYDVRKNLDTVKNPFYTHARIQLFLALDGKTIVGRIAAIVNDNHNKKYNDKVGFFGYFECINSKEVSVALFEAAGNWLKENGMDTIRGPINLSVNDEVGLLVDGYDKPAVLLMMYNPRYYEKLILDYGFIQAKEMYAYIFGEDQIKVNPKSIQKLERVADIVVKRDNIKIRKIVLKDLENELLKVMKVYNSAWIDNWGSVQMTEDEFKFVAASLKPLVDADIVYFAEVNGEPVGFSLSMPDWNKIFKNLNGKLFPFGIFKILTGRKKIDGIRVMIMGIIPEYQRKGIEAVFINNTIKIGNSKGYKYAEISWILEDNVPMVQTAINLGAEKYKTYRVYDKQI